MVGRVNAARALGTLQRLLGRRNVRRVVREHSSEAEEDADPGAEQSGRRQVGELRDQSHLDALGDQERDDV